MSLSNRELEKRREKNLIATKNLLYKDPFIVTRGEMQYLFDENDNKYLDMLGGFSVVAFGHNNSYINDHIKKQLDKVTHSTQIFLNEPIVELSERLHKNLDNSLSKTFFLNSGSEANEMAILIARTYTKKHDVLYMQYSLHGRTDLTLSITNMTMWHPYPDMNNLDLLVKNYYPDDHVSFEEQMELSLEDLEEKMSRNNNIACMIIEPIQGNAGVRYPHPDYFKRLHKILKKHSILLIMDEAQTGLGRLGTIYAHQYFGIVPDLLMTCKSLGNGFPISSVTTTDKIVENFRVPSASTNGGNMVSCSSAIGSLKYFEKFNILENIQPLITKFDEILNEFQKYDIVKSIRGIGMLRGIELDPEVCDNAVNLIKEQGIIVGKAGVNREIILLEPPLVIQEKDLDYFYKKMSKILTQLEGN